MKSNKRSIFMAVPLVFFTVSIVSAGNINFDGEMKSKIFVSEKISAHAYWREDTISGVEDMDELGDIRIGSPVMISRENMEWLDVDRLC